MSEIISLREFRQSREERGYERLLAQIKVEGEVTPIPPGMIQTVIEGINREIEKLEPLEKDVILSRYGLEAGKSLSPKEIGKRLRKRPSMISEIEANALNKLRFFHRHRRGILGEI